MTQGLCVLDGSLTNNDIEEIIMDSCKNPLILDYWDALDMLRKWLRPSNTTNLVQVISGDLASELVGELGDIEWSLKDTTGPDYKGYLVTSDLVVFDCLDAVGFSNISPAGVADSLVEFWETGKVFPRRIIIAPNATATREGFFEVLSYEVNHTGSNLTNGLRDTWNRHYPGEFAIFQFIKLRKPKAIA